MTFLLLAFSCSGSDEPSPDADADGWTVAAGDCDDSDAEINPGVEEDVKDYIDANCDGGDETDYDHDGYHEDVDCNDFLPSINPDAVEECNHQDDDCDDLIDEEVGYEVWTDSDHDQHGAIGASAGYYCDPPDGFSSVSDDCDDTEPTTNPDALEYCDGRDNNCDGLTDENCP